MGRRKTAAAVPAEDEYSAEGLIQQLPPQIGVYRELLKTAKAHGLSERWVNGQLEARGCVVIDGADPYMEGFSWQVRNEVLDELRKEPPLVIEETPQEYGRKPATREDYEDVLAYAEAKGGADLRDAVAARYLELVDERGLERFEWPVLRELQYFVDHAHEGNKAEWQPVASTEGVILGMDLGHEPDFSNADTTEGFALPQDDANTNNDPAGAEDGSLAATSPESLSEVAQVPAPIQTDDGRLIDPETGEVLGIVECFSQLGVSEDDAREFVIDDEEKAKWFVEQIRLLQHSTEDVARQAASIIKRNVKVIDGLMTYFGPQLKAWAEPQLKRYKKGAKAGRLSEKALSLLVGDIVFRGTGGLYIKDAGEYHKWESSLIDKALLQQRVDLIAQTECAEALEEYGDCLKIKVEVRVDKKKLLKKISDTGCYVPGVDKEPEDETGVVAIGVDKRPWSLNNAKKLVTDPLKHLKLKYNTQADGGPDADAESVEEVA